MDFINIKHIRINGYLQVPENMNLGMLKELLEQQGCYFLGYMEDNVEYSVEEFLDIINSKIEGEVDKSVLGEVKYLTKEKKEKLRSLCGSANSRIDLNKMREELKYGKDKENE